MISLSSTLNTRDNNNNNNGDDDDDDDIFMNVTKLF